jgi:hypothetical protein
MKVTPEELRRRLAAPSRKLFDVIMQVASDDLTLAKALANLLRSKYPTSPETAMLDICFPEFAIT